ncbi:MAG: recombinase family protein [Bacteroides sp.]|uniref:hypothetical protein n=1 Tax=Bacteroides sp. TaxID=29523 RepID=UPI002FCA5026
MKTTNEDRLGSKCIRNIGQAARYMSIDNHPTIVSKEVFDRVQEEKKNRGKNADSCYCFQNPLLVNQIQTTLS